jgi:hypothetical protein
MEIANVLTVECDDGMEPAQIGPRLGAELIGGSVYEIEHGKKLWPYGDSPASCTGPPERTRCETRPRRLSTLIFPRSSSTRTGASSTP